MAKRLHNPFPASLNSECVKAGEILERFVNPKSPTTPGREIPAKILTRAKGLAIFTVSKVGFLGSVRIGSGILVARLEDGTWSAPSATSLAGIGGGGQFGFELSDFVFILHDERAVRAFSKAGTLTIGGNVSLAFGPIGRSLEGGGAAGGKGVGGIFAWSTTRGLFGGVSIEGSVMVERSSANRKMYGGEVTAQQLLAGHMPPPPAAEPLMQILNSHVFSPGSSPEPPADTSSEQPEHHSDLSQEIAYEPPSLPPLDLPSETNHEPPSEQPAPAAPEHPARLPPQLPNPQVGSQNIHSDTPEHPDRLPPPPPNPHVNYQNTHPDTPEQVPETQARPSD